MKPIDSFLREHAFVHTRAVAEAFPFNVDYLFDDLTDAQLRLRPHGMNSFAWLFWHMARVEDGHVSYVVLGRPQLFDEESWGERLGIDTRAVTTGKDGVAALSEAIDLAALRAYRDAVGRRTRAMALELWPDLWDAPIDVSDVRMAIEAGVSAPEALEYLPGRPREGALQWWGVHHSLMHLGQANMLRGVIRGKS